MKLPLSLSLLRSIKYVGSFGFLALSQEILLIKIRDNYLQRENSTSLISLKLPFMQNFSNEGIEDKSKQKNIYEIRNELLKKKDN